MSHKSLTEEEMEELRKILTQRDRANLYITLLSAASAAIGAVGTALAALIVALKTKG